MKLKAAALILPLALGLLAAPLPAEAEQAGKVYRIALLSPRLGPDITDPFIAALRERGWNVGQNLLLETYETRADPQRAEALARELVAQGVDLFVTNVTTTAMAVHRITKSVPIVMMTSGFPVEGGLAKSLARPGGNVTGVTVYAGGALFGKFVQLLQELVPSLRELGVFWGYAPPSYTAEQVAPATDELRRAAKALNVEVRFWQTGRESDLDDAIAAAAAAPLDALFVTAGMIHGRKEFAPRIRELILRRRLPTLTDFRGAFFRTGAAVLAYSADFKATRVRTAYYVDRILRGAKPGDLPIEQPTKFDLVINLKTANALGLTIPPSLLFQADRVIK